MKTTLILLLWIAFLTILSKTYAQYAGTPYPCNGGTAKTQPGSWISFATHDCGANGVAFNNTNSSSSPVNATITDGTRSSGEGMYDVWKEDKVPGGYSLGYNSTGEWMKYTIDVPKTVTERLEIIYFICCKQPLASTSKIKITSIAEGGNGNETSLGEFTLTNIKGADIWDTAVFYGITLAAGRQVLKIEITKAMVNLATFMFVEDNTTSEQYTGVPYPCPSYPSGSAAHAIPGDWINFSAHDCGAKSVTFNNINSSSNKNNATLTDGTRGGGEGIFDVWADTLQPGGYSLGFNAIGEWMKYTVDVQTTGTYDLDIIYYVCCSKPLGQEVKVRFSSIADKGNGMENLLGEYSMYNNNGADQWDTANFSGISLTAGKQVIKVEITKDLLNLSAFKLILAGTGSTTELNDHSPNIIIYPNPAKDKIVIQNTRHEAINTSRMEITDMQGRIVISQLPNNSSLNKEVTETIDIRNLINGMHFIKIYSGNNITVKKIIKLSN